MGCVDHPDADNVRWADGLACLVCMRLVSRPVQGCCPACGRRALTVGDGDRRLRCSAPGCSRPDALAEIIEDGEIHHVVRFRDGNVTVKHPLIERAGGALFECRIHGMLDGLELLLIAGIGWLVVAVLSLVLDGWSLSVFNAFGIGVLMITLWLNFRLLIGWMGQVNRQLRRRR